MSPAKWNITLKIHRQKQGERPYFEDFPMEVDPDEYVLDAVERVWAFMDRTLCFRHACHHSTCGACGMRVNGTEKLTCITRIRDVTHDGGTIRVEPLRNFPIVSDLVVDMARLYAGMEQVGLCEITPDAPLPGDGASTYLRLTDCIEC